MLPSLGALARRRFLSFGTGPQFFSTNFATKGSNRSYATHRDISSRWRRGNSGGGSSSSFWQKWKVPLLFTAGVLAFDHTVMPYAFDSNKTLARHPEYLVYGIMGLNVGAFLLWRVPAAQPFMNRYFLLQKYPSRFNAWSMIGSAFSHQEMWHLGINMFVLWQFGIPVARWLGTSNFMQSYMDSCVLSSLGSLMIPHLLSNSLMLPSLGASGAIYSMVGIFSYLAPNARLALWFIPLPIGAWWVFLLSVGYNAFQIARRGPSGFDHAGHLAGALTGIGWGWLATEKFKERRRKVMEDRARVERDLGFFGFGRGT